MSELASIRSLSAPGGRVSLASSAGVVAAADRSLPIGLVGVDAALPDGGLPRGAVVEIASPGGLGRATALALAACASAQREATGRGDIGSSGAWCAWLEAGESLFAPAVARAGVDLTRLLVVRPPPSLGMLARVAVRVAASRVFSVIVVDAAGVPGAAAREPLDRWSTAVRRLALGVEGSDTSLVLLTDSRARRSMPLPVAMRIELERPAVDRLTLRIAKDRRGRVASPQTIALAG